MSAEQDAAAALQALVGTVRNVVVLLEDGIGPADRRAAEAAHLLRRRLDEFDATVVEVLHDHLDDH